jgi:hypothetical protein
LRWIVFVEKCDRDTHRTRIIHGDILGLVDIDRVIVVIVWILLGSVSPIEDEILMSLTIVQIGKPTDSLDSDILGAIRINSVA